MNTHRSHQALLAIAGVLLAVGVASAADPAPLPPAEEVLSIERVGPVVIASPDGKTLLYTSVSELSGTTAQLRDLAGGTQSPLLAGEQIMDARIAPGGQVVATVRRAPRAALCLADAQGKSVGVAFDPDADFHFADGNGFSVDGTTLYAWRQRHEPAPAPPTTQPVRVTASFSAADLVPAGTRIDLNVHTDERLHRSRLFKQPIGPIDLIAVRLDDVARPQSLIPIQGSSVESLCVSPDGSKLAVFYREGWQLPDVALLIVDLAAPQPAEPWMRSQTLVPTSLRWNADGSRLFALDTRGQLVVIDPVAKRAETIVHTPPVVAPGHTPWELQQARFNAASRGDSDTRIALSASDRSAIWVAQFRLFRADLSADPITSREIRSPAIVGIDSLIGIDQPGDVVRDGCVLVSTISASKGTLGVSRMNLATSQRDDLAAERAAVFYAASTPDGSRAFFAHESGSLPSDLAEMRFDAPAPSLQRLGLLNRKIDAASYGEKRVLTWRHPSSVAAGGVLVMPTVPSPFVNGKFPLVIIGYPQEPVTWQVVTYQTPFFDLARRFARRGIATLMPTIPIKRTDAAGANQMLEIVTGLHAGADAAIKEANIEPGMMGVMGYSWGGYLAYCAITQSDRFRYAAAGAGFIDPVGLYTGPGDASVIIGNDNRRGGLGGPPWVQKQRYIDTSPLFDVGKANTPVLIFVGGEDDRVPPEHSRQAFRALSAAKQSAVLVEYARGGHGLSDWPTEQKVDLVRRLDEWFGRLAPPKP